MKKKPLVCKVCGSKKVELNNIKILDFMYKGIKFIITNLEYLNCKICLNSTLSEISDKKYNKAMIKFSNIVKKLGLKNG